MFGQAYLKLYPICDTDIWIKLSKVSRCHVVFDIFKKLIFSDAVVSELIKKSNDNKGEFGCALDNYELEENSKRAIRVDYCNSSYFDKDMQLALRRMFVEFKISYDENEKTFALAPHLGEKVSLIYASILKLKILLSDDNGIDEHKKSFIESKINNFPYIEVIRLNRLLRKCGFGKEEANDICFQANKSWEKLTEESFALSETKENFNKGIYKTKSLSTLKKALELKNKI